LRECRLTPAERVTITDVIERRVVERVPAAYLIGRAWFAGLEMVVTPDVLVPRSPIAELVEVGFEPWVDGDQVGRVLDLCCGGGCIGIAAAVYLPEANVDLVDISAPALAVAERNAEHHGVTDRVRILASDLFAALGDARYDVIVSNPPYVSRAELERLPAEYRNEPHQGLFGGEDGLDIVVRILADAANHLTDDGVLILEVGSSAIALEERLPTLPFTWLDFERGGEGVCLLTRGQLERHQLELLEEATAR
jgi:ribosomal protein L3 glutamine methyltransferase